MNMPIIILPFLHMESHMVSTNAALELGECIWNCERICWSTSTVYGFFANYISCYLSFWNFSHEISIELVRIFFGFLIKISDKRNNFTNFPQGDFNARCLKWFCSRYFDSQIRQRRPSNSGSSQLRWVEAKDGRKWRSRVAPTHHQYRRSVS